MVIKQLLEEFDEDIIKAFVQKNADYYLVKWKLMAETYSKTSWNWPAFLFGAFWLSYRKMYLYTFLFIATGIFTLIPFIGFILALALWIGLGLFGNYIYGQYVYKRLKELSLMAKNEDELKILVLQKGGVSVIAVIILTVLFLLLELIVIVLVVSSSSHYY